MADPSEEAVPNSFRDAIVLRYIQDEHPKEEWGAWWTHYRWHFRKNPGDRRFATMEKLMDKTVDAIIKKAEVGNSERRIIDEQRKYIDLLYQLCGLLMEKLEKCRADLRGKA